MKRSDEMRALRKEYSKKRSTSIEKAKRLLDAGIKTYLPEINFPAFATLSKIDNYVSEENLDDNKMKEILRTQIEDYDNFLGKDINVPKFKKWVKSNPKGQDIVVINFLAKQGIYEFDIDNAMEWINIYHEIADKARKVGIGSDEAVQLLNSLNVDMENVKGSIMEGLDRRTTRLALTNIFKSYKGSAVNVDDINKGFVRNSARDAAKLFKFNL